MAGMIVKTGKPSGLLTAIYQAIDDKKVVTWLYDKDKDLTHEPEQWKDKAWFRPKVHNGDLKFGLLGPKGVTMSKELYGVYHGRLMSAMLLTHFDDEFTLVYGTSQKQWPDNFE